MASRLGVARKGGPPLQAARRRLVKLFRAGRLERFRPYSPRGSYEWTYFLSAAGHRLLREIGVIDPGARFKPRDVFDYGRALHDIQLNAWILAYRRQLGPALLEWHGEHQITPRRTARQAQLRLSDDCSVEGLRDPQPRPVVPDAALEIAHDRTDSPRLLLIEYDRTSSTDKNYDKFRRYDNYLAWWWRHTELGERAEPPFVLFVCQDDAQRDDFLARADHELTGHHWHPTHTPNQHKYIARRHILFCNERDAPPRPARGPPTAPVPGRTPRTSRPRGRGPRSTASRTRNRRQSVGSTSGGSSHRDNPRPPSEGGRSRMTGDGPGRVPDEAAEVAKAVLEVTALGELAEAVAARVVELLEHQERRSARGLATAADVAEQLGVHKSWVYAHADELGAIRLGEGEKARLRFDPERVARAVDATLSEPDGRRAGWPRRHGLSAGVRLIEGRGN